MDVITQVGTWMVESLVSLWSAVGTWGVIGFGIIAIPVIAKVIRLMRKLISF